MEKKWKKIPFIRIKKWEKHHFSTQNFGQKDSKKAGKRLKKAEKIKFKSPKTVKFAEFAEKIRENEK
jgi:hypothetical protein